MKENRWILHAEIIYYPAYLSCTRGRSVCWNSLLEARKYLFADRRTYFNVYEMIVLFSHSSNGVSVNLCVGLLINSITFVTSDMRACYGLVTKQALDAFHPMSSNRYLLVYDRGILDLVTDIEFLLTLEMIEAELFYASHAIGDIGQRNIA